MPFTPNVKQTKHFFRHTKLSFTPAIFIGFYSLNNLFYLLFFNSDSFQQALTSLPSLSTYPPSPTPLVPQPSPQRLSRRIANTNPLRS